MPAVIVALAVLLLPAAGFSWPARVVKVEDGDTIVVRHQRNTETIDLYGIDCPETGQPYGSAATHYLSSRIGGETINVEPLATSAAGRTLALIYHNRSCLNEGLLDQGLAWVYPPHCREKFCEKWNRLQIRANETGKGLWNRIDSLPPWLWRQQQRRSGPGN